MSRELKTLERHLRHWRDAGLVDAALEERLRASSQVLARDGAGAVVRNALAVLGGGLLLAGLVLVVAENWAALPRAVKLAGWGAILAGFHTAGELIRRRLPDRPALSEALALVSGGWILAGIALVSQIYHLDARPPNGIWLWLALLLPAAWLAPRRAVSVVAFAALLSGLFLECLEDGSWIAAARADGPWLAVALPLLAGSFALRLPRAAGGLRDWLGVWVFGALQVCLLVLGATQDLDHSDLGRAWIVAGAGLVMALAWPQSVLPSCWGARTARAVLLLGLSPWPLLGAEHEKGAILDNVAIGWSWIVPFVLAVLVIRAGAAAGSRAWVNIGYLALVGAVATRYFDFFGDFLEGGAALALTGLLVLFALWMLDKARRRTLALEVPR